MALRRLSSRYEVAPCPALELGPTTQNRSSTVSPVDLWSVIPTIVHHAVISRYD